MIFASGRYVDRIAVRQMQYKERVMNCDSRRFDTLLAIQQTRPGRIHDVTRINQFEARRISKAIVSSCGQ
jgi:hypothetical protein